MLPLPLGARDAASFAISVMFVPFATMLPLRLMLLPACAVKLPPAKVSVRLVRRLMSTCACKSTDPLVRNPPSIAATETWEVPPGKLVRLLRSLNRIEQVPPGGGQG